jgi:molybdopterin-guanine dinucleotide biosynthesis protein A
MGRDKALLSHPEGGTWLERTLLLLAQLDVPITLLSRHAAHLELAEALQTEFKPRGVALELIAEQSPREGPLLALHRLMECHPEQRLLLCPVDMPDLSLGALMQLTTSEPSQPGCIQVAHDGERLQPLLGIYSSSAPIRAHLAGAVERGERRLQSWLVELPYQAVPLDPRAIRNVNRPEAGQPVDSPSASTMRSQRSNSSSRGSTC